MHVSAIGRGSEPVLIDLVKDGQTVLTDAISLVNGRGEYAFDLPTDLFGTVELTAYRFRRRGPRPAKEARAVYPAGERAFRSGHETRPQGIPPRPEGGDRFGAGRQRGPADARGDQPLGGRRGGLLGPEPAARQRTIGLHAGRRAAQAGARAASLVAAVRGGDRSAAIAINSSRRFSPQFGAVTERHRGVRDRLATRFEIDQSRRHSRPTRLARLPAFLRASPRNLALLRNDGVHDSNVTTYPESGGSRKRAADGLHVPHGPVDRCSSSIGLCCLVGVCACGASFSLVLRASVRTDPVFDQWAQCSCQRSMRPGKRQSETTLTEAMRPHFCHGYHYATSSSDVRPQTTISHA